MPSAGCSASWPCSRAPARTVARGDIETGIGLAIALRWFWLMRGLSTEGRQWFRTLLATPGAAPGAATELLRAEALHVAGNLAQNQGDLDEAVEQFEQGLA